MHFYNNKKYYYAIRDYQKGDNSQALALLNYLRAEAPKFDEDINSFITEIQSIAISRQDKAILNYTKDLGKNISRKDGNPTGLNYSIERSLETENECVIVLKTAVQNGDFFVAIDSIIKFITTYRRFHTAFLILSKIDELPNTVSSFTRSDIALLFIEKMFMIIHGSIIPTETGGIIKKYSAGGYYWEREGEFSSSDFIKYQKIVKKYTDQYGIKQCIELSMQRQKEAKEQAKVKIEQAKEGSKHSFPFEVLIGCSYSSSYRPIYEKVVINRITYDGHKYVINYQFKNDPHITDGDIFLQYLDSGKHKILQGNNGEVEIVTLRKDLWFRIILHGKEWNHDVYSKPSSELIKITTVQDKNKYYVVRDELYKDY